MYLIVGHIREKIKDLKIKAEETPLFLSFLIILVALASFGLGRLSLLEERRTPVTINNVAPEETSPIIQEKENIVTTQPEPQATDIVASKNGTRYYFPWCGGLSRISEQNKVTFSSTKEAEVAGYTIAANCTAP
ncbi:MAG: hypothetical protein AAB756_02440 [Patescibacteria group bacterium]